MARTGDFLLMTGAAGRIRKASSTGSIADWNICLNISMRYG
jgi:hypothetical protein